MKKLKSFLAKIVTPVAMAFLFFAVVTPVALLMRLFGRDALRLKRSTAASYWVPRMPPGPARGFLRDEF